MGRRRNVNTRIYDRRQAMLANGEAKKQAERQELIERAFKSVDVELTDDPKARIRTLEKYIEGLREIRSDIEQNYSKDEWGLSSWNVMKEIHKTLEAISAIRMELIDTDYISEEDDMQQRLEQAANNPPRAPGVQGAVTMAVRKAIEESLRSRGLLPADKAG